MEGEKSTYKRLDVVEMSKKRVEKGETVLKKRGLGHEVGWGWGGERVRWNCPAASAGLFDRQTEVPGCQPAIRPARPPSS